MHKLASVVWFKIYPAHFGGQKGIALFNESLAEHVAVDCWCAAANKKLEKSSVHIFPVLPDGKTQFSNPLVWINLYHRIKKGNYSGIIIEFPYYAFLGVWLKKNGHPFVLHAHNIEAERFRKLKKRWWRIFAFYEKWAMKKADMVLLKTEKDVAYAVKKYEVDRGKCHLVPYGIDKVKVHDKQACRRFLEEQYGIHPQEKILLFAGTLDYLPNAEAVHFIYFKLLPLLLSQSPFTFKILICGRNQYKKFSYLHQYRHERIVQAGFVGDINIYFTGADVFINPVQKVFGVQTKVVDAISYNLNTVTFEEAQTGLPDYLLGEKLFIAQSGDVASFTRQTITAMNKNKATPARFFHDYSWDTIVRGVAEKIAQIRLKN